MSYYTRIFSPSAKVPPVEPIRMTLAKVGAACSLTVESGTDENWAKAILAHKNGSEIAEIERNTASLNNVFSEEIKEFLEEITDCKPASAATWLADYLPKVKTIYAFHILSGTEEKNGWEILHHVKNSIFTQVGGITQADGEGFSDEEGYHILWQFSDSVKGKWWMSVLKDGAWIRFQMDLGNKKQRAAFLQGEVPDGVQMR